MASVEDQEARQMALGVAVAYANLVGVLAGIAKAAGVDQEAILEGIDKLQRMNAETIEPAECARIINMQVGAIADVIRRR